MPAGGHHANIDCIGRNSYMGECRGHVVMDYTAPAAQFWAEVAKTGEEIAREIEPCPHAPGTCEFHDAEEA